MNKIKVFSLFSGVGGFEIGIDRALGKENIEIVGFCQYEPGANVQHASNVLRYRYPNVKNYGDITKIDYNSLPDFDLLVGGPPCTDISIAGKREGLQGDRSILFYNYVDILRIKKPKYFIMENVASMDDKICAVINKELGCYPINLNASLVSAQNRSRYFWTNIPGSESDLFSTNVIGQPKDKNIRMKDIITLDIDDQIHYDKIVKRGVPDIDGMIQLGSINDSNAQANRVYSLEGKSVNLTANGGGGGAKTGLYLTRFKDIYETYPRNYMSMQKYFDMLKDKGVLKDYVRNLYPEEAEALMTWECEWTKYGIDDKGEEYELPKTWRLKLCGNGVVSNVIKHICEGLKNELKQE